MDVVRHAMDHVEVVVLTIVITGVVDVLDVVEVAQEPVEKTIAAHVLVTVEVAQVIVMVAPEHVMVDVIGPVPMIARTLAHPTVLVVVKRDVLLHVPEVA